MRVLAFLLLAACSGTPAADSAAAGTGTPEPSSGAESAASVACAELSEALLAAASLAGEAQGDPVAYSAQLDGQGERETVLSVRLAIAGEPENPMAPLTLRDHLWCSSAKRVR